MAHDMAQAEKARAARTSPLLRANIGTRETAQPRPLDTDIDKLRAIRLGMQVSLQAIVNIANRIHHIEMRDAALGNIVKTRIRDVLTTPALLKSLAPEKETLKEIADMMSDDMKRASMLKRVAKMTDRKD